MKKYFTTIGLCLFQLIVFLMAGAQTDSQHSGNINKSTTTAGSDSKKDITLSATTNGKNIELKWITPSTIDMHHFAVQRSFNNKDFKTVGLVLDGIHNQSGNKTYMFRESASLLTGSPVLYYRLEEVANDGSAMHSEILEVNCMGSSVAMLER